MELFWMVRNLISGKKWEFELSLEIASMIKDRVQGYKV